MRKKNKLTRASVGLFKRVLIDIQEKGKSKVCPVRVLGNAGFNDCYACHAAFPKPAKWQFDGKCPCHKNYNKAYLIRRVKTIIETGEL